MGQALADTVGFPEPPMTIEDSSRGVLEQVSLIPSPLLPPHSILEEEDG